MTMNVHACITVLSQRGEVNNIVIAYAAILIKEHLGYVK